MNMFKDFDRMFAQIKGERIPFRIHGKEYSIDSDLPADIVLRLARCEGSVPPQLVIEAAERIFGPDVLQEICAHEGFTMSKLEALLSWAFAAAGGGAMEDAPDEPKN